MYLPRSLPVATSAKTGCRTATAMHAQHYHWLWRRGEHRHGGPWLPVIGASSAAAAGIGSPGAVRQRKRCETWCGLWILIGQTPEEGVSAARSACSCLSARGGGGGDSGAESGRAGTGLGLPLTGAARELHATGVRAPRRPLPVGAVHAGVLVPPLPRAPGPARLTDPAFDAAPAFGGHAAVYPCFRHAVNASYRSAQPPVRNGLESSS